MLWYADRLSISLVSLGEKSAPYQCIQSQVGIDIPLSYCYCQKLCYCIINLFFL